MSDELPPKYALIKWLTGTDSGTYTPDVPIEWVRDFNYHEYLNIADDDQERYIIEWHAGKKPLGGWPCYDGEVIQVSDKKAVLERLFKTLKCKESPNLKVNQHPKTMIKSVSPKKKSPPLINQDSEASGWSHIDEMDKDLKSPPRLAKVVVHSFHGSKTSEESDSPEVGMNEKEIESYERRKKLPRKKESNEAKIKKKKQKLRMENVEETESLNHDKQIMEIPANRVPLAQKSLNMNPSDADYSSEEDHTQKKKKSSPQIPKNPKATKPVKSFHHGNAKQQNQQNGNQIELDMILNAMQKQIASLVGKENVDEDAPLNVNTTGKNPYKRDEMEKDKVS